MLEKTCSGNFSSSRVSKPADAQRWSDVWLNRKNSTSVSGKYLTLNEVQFKFSCSGNSGRKTGLAYWLMQDCTHWVLLCHILCVYYPIFAFSFFFKLCAKIKLNAEKHAFVMSHFLASQWQDLKAGGWLAVNRGLNGTFSWSSKGFCGLLIACGSEMKNLLS